MFEAIVANFVGAHIENENPETALSTVSVDVFILSIIAAPTVSTDDDVVGDSDGVAVGGPTENQGAHSYSLSKHVDPKVVHYVDAPTDNENPTTAASTVSADVLIPLLIIVVAHECSDVSTSNVYHCV